MFGDKEKFGFLGFGLIGFDICVNGSCSPLVMAKHMKPEPFDRQVLTSKLDGFSELHGARQGKHQLRLRHAAPPSELDGLPSSIKLDKDNISFISVTQLLLLS